MAHENDEMSHRPDWPEPRRRNSSIVVAGDRHRRVETSVGRQVLDLDVDEHLGAAGVEGSGQRRHGSPGVLSADGTAGRDEWIVADEQFAGRRDPHIELHTVGALLVGEFERLDRVLRRVGRRSTVGDHEHRCSLACAP